MTKTKIEWCDSTWNPITGCLHGCPYCYARVIAKRFKGGGLTEDGHYIIRDCRCREISDNILDTPEYRKTKKGKIVAAPYPKGFLPAFRRYRLDEPSKWEIPRNIFVGSMCDLFGECVPDEWISEAFKACEAAPQHRYLFLTKNPKRYGQLKEKDLLPPEHWYGITRDGKNSAGRTVYALDYKFFASYEPLLEDVGDCGCFPWIIIGAETGNRKGKIKTERAWVENLANCVSARNNYTKVFMKDSLLPIMGEQNMLRELPWAGKYGSREVPWNKTEVTK